MSSRCPFRRRFVVVVGCWLVSALASEALGQALEELRSDVRTSSPGEPSSPPPPDRDDCYDDHCGDEGDLIGLGLLLVAAPFWGPPIWAGDTYKESGYFAHYPYEYGEGYMLIGPPEAAGLNGPRQPYATAARGRAEYGTDFDDLQWIGGHVLVETSPRFGLESDFRYVKENLRAGPDDALWFGDANLLFRFTQSEFLVMRTGLGINFLSDHDGSDLGFNFTYGGDFFPVQPLVLSAELDLGTLGHTHVYHFRTTLGANRGIAEAFLGYDYYDIGPTQISGLVAGLRLWY